MKKAPTIKREQIWIVIPGYNEDKYIDSVLTKLTNLQDRVIFVDDGSSDNTVAIAEKHLNTVLVHRVNLGKGAAMKTGSEYAFNELGAEAVIFMDSDDQHDPTELELFFAELENGAAVVFGERRMGSEMPLLRIIGNRFASFLIYVLFGTYIPDIPSGFKALTKNAYKRINWQANRYEVELEIAAKVAKYKIPFRTVEIKTIYHDMDRGMSPLDALRMISKTLLWKVNL